MRHIMMIFTRDYLKKRGNKLNKTIIIINGSGSWGKDTFVHLVKKNCKYQVMNYSSVNKVKMIAKMGGWDGGKTEKDRKLLSDLKLLFSDYNDMPYKDVVEVIDIFKGNNCPFLFIHVREPDEIQRFVNDFGAKTLLITNNNIKRIESNMADANVLNFAYDYTINNNDTIEDLEQEAIKFIKEIGENK